MDMVVQSLLTTLGTVLVLVAGFVVWWFKFEKVSKTELKGELAALKLQDGTVEKQNRELTLLNNALETRDKLVQRQERADYLDKLLEEQFGLAGVAGKTQGATDKLEGARLRSAIAAAPIVSIAVSEIRLNNKNYPKERAELNITTAVATVALMAEPIVEAIREESLVQRTGLDEKQITRLANMALDHYESAAFLMRSFVQEADAPAYIGESIERLAQAWERKNPDSTVPELLRRHDDRKRDEEGMVSPQLGVT